jgi:hypothetical protein
MKCGARVALGVAGGYFLGRTKKMKVALMLGGMAAGRRAGGPTELLAQGAKLLGQSPELTRLTEEIRGRLLEAGKGAAMAVATRQVESLTDRVGKRVESLGDLGDLGGEVGQKSGQEPEQDANDEYDEPADEGAGYDDQDDAAASGDGGEEELPSGSSSTADQSRPARSGAAVNSNAAAAILKRTASATTSGTPAQRARPARPRPAARAGGPARARRSGSDD